MDNAVAESKFKALMKEHHGGRGGEQAKENGEVKAKEEGGRHAEASRRRVRARGVPIRTLARENE